MIFESRGAEFLISLYKNNYFDEKKYKEWINTHEMKGDILNFARKISHKPARPGCKFFSNITRGIFTQL